MIQISDGKRYEHDLQALFDIWGTTATPAAVDCTGTVWFVTRGHRGGWSPGLLNGDKRGFLTCTDNLQWRHGPPAGVDIPSEWVCDVVVAPSGTVWMGTWGKGLVKHQGSSWSVLDTSNSSIPAMYTCPLLTTSDGDVWFSLLEEYEGVRRLPYGRMDGTNSYTSSRLRSIGLGRFDGDRWQVYNTENSGLPHNEVNSMDIDRAGNLWIGTEEGLAVFNENGIQKLSSIDVLPRQDAGVHRLPLSGRLRHAGSRIMLETMAPWAVTVDISLYSPAGRLVSKLGGIRVGAGRHLVPVPVERSLAGAVIVWRLEIRDFDEQVRTSHGIISTPVSQ